MKKVRMCYPFLKERSLKCDYEIETDALATFIGYAFSKAGKYPKMKGELQWLCEMAYHANGSIRGKLAIQSEDIEKIIRIHYFYQESVEQEIRMFSLPLGCELACILHLCRSKSKHSVRLAYKIEKQENIKVNKLLIDLLNIMADLFFVMAVFVNKNENIEIIEFVSKSYEIRF